MEIIGGWYLIADAIGIDNYERYYFLIQGILQLIVILTFIIITNKSTGKPLFGKPNFKWYLLALVLGASFVFIQTPLNWLYNPIFETEYLIAYRFDGLPKFLNLNIITTILLIPIAEELFFRQYIQKYLQSKMKGIYAILFASILFASIHSPYTNLVLELSKQDWHLFYLTFFGGVISGSLYYYSKSIGSSICFHIIWNSMSIFV
jgi:membrane protease YdiL (CAAX protease family)